MENLTVIIPFWNGHDKINRLLSTIPTVIPVIIVDDLSDKPLELTAENATVIRPNKKGFFTGACNAGINACDTDILILNQDTWFSNDDAFFLLTELSSQYDMIGEGIHGTNKKWPDGYIHGTFLYASRRAINAVGVMSEYYPLWGSTCEWQLRFLRKGFNVKKLDAVPGFNHEHREWNEYGSAITEMIKRHPSQKNIYLRTPPEISVIVPCYNYGRYLHDAVNSLIGGDTCLGHHPGQTFQSFEIIIIDDGSTDDSLDIALSMASHEKGIRVISKQNGGTASAINAGISHANGNYITILSSDDMMEPWRLEALINAIVKAPAKHYVYDDLRIIANGDRHKELALGKYDWERLRHKNHVHAGILFPIKAWHETKGYPQIMGDGREDWAFNIALGIAGYRGINIERPGYLYRREGQNRTEAQTKLDMGLFIEKIMFLYPHLYTEKELMACCGGAAKNLSAGYYKGKRSPDAIAGSSGMVMIEYIGKNASDTSWWGGVTRTRYVTGGITRRIYIDSRDLPSFLQFSEDGQKACFKHIDLTKMYKVDPKPESVEVTATKKAVVTAVAAPVVKKAVQIAELEAPTIAVVKLPDLTTMSVRDIRTHLADNTYTNDELDQLITAEKEAKNRDSVVATMEKYKNAS